MVEGIFARRGEIWWIRVLYTPCRAAALPRFAARGVDAAKAGRHPWGYWKVAANRVRGLQAFGEREGLDGGMPCRREHLEAGRRDICGAVGRVGLRVLCSGWRLGWYRCTLQFA